MWHPHMKDLSAGFVLAPAMCVPVLFALKVITYQTVGRAIRSRWTIASALLGVVLAISATTPLLRLLAACFLAPLVQLPVYAVIAAMFRRIGGRNWTTYRFKATYTMGNSRTLLLILSQRLLQSWLEYSCRCGFSRSSRVFAAIDGVLGPADTS